MNKVLRIAGRIDRLCARLNDGVLAFAVVLAVAEATAWVVCHPEIFQVEYDAAAAAVGIAPDAPGEVVGSEARSCGQPGAKPGAVSQGSEMPRPRAGPCRSFRLLDQMKVTPGSRRNDRP
jgi:hypothetical protein